MKGTTTSMKGYSDSQQSTRIGEGEGMKVSIVEWHAVSTWHWNLVPDSAQDARGHDGGYMDELCGICRVAFDGTCPNCKYPGNECPLVLGGGCTHNFHLHCILKWLEQDTSKGLCPMCRQVFTPHASYTSGEDVAKLAPAFKELQLLIDGHKVLRERLQTNGDQDFEQFDEDLQMSG